jgi:hypothetical protein
MSETPGAPDAPVPPYEDSSTAPFVYFDLVPTHGIMNGAIQIELAARVLLPKDGGGVLVKFVACGRLRCSPVAAGHLRDAIVGALKMLEQPQEGPTAASKLN